MSDRLAVILPGVTMASGRHVELHPKTLSGLAAYAARWPGPVSVITQRGSESGQNHLGESWHDPRGFDFDLHLTGDVVASARDVDPVLTVAPLHERYAEILGYQSPVVMIADNPPQVAVEYQLVEAMGVMRRSRIRLGGFRRARTLAHMARACAGIACNGPLTEAFFARMNSQTLTFFDGRLHSEAVMAAKSTRAPAGPTRLGFSGRWVPQKGVLDAIAAAQDAGLHIDVLGGGPLADEVLRQRGSLVDVIGSLDFELEWVPYVRDHIDLMVLPHVQPDSSSTYLESLGSGAPVLAYGNEYWRALERMSGGGWMCAAGSQAELASTLRKLTTREALATPRRRGLEFAERHTFEATFDRRVEHLRLVANV